MNEAYDRVGEVMNSFLVTDERAVDGVDDERRPADDERDDNEDQRHCDVPLLLVDFVLVDCRTVSQMSPVRPYHSQHAAFTRTTSVKANSMAIVPRLAPWMFNAVA